MQAGRIGWIKAILFITVLLSAICALREEVSAATLTVNSTADAVDANPGNGVCATAGGVCTLRAAIQEANALAGGPHTVSIPAGTYTLTIPGRAENLNLTGDLDILQNMSIKGAGANVSIIDGGGIDRVFHVKGATATISGVTVRNGNSGTDALEDGGGVLDEGTLTLTDVALRGNTTAGNGGGVYNKKGALTLERVTASANTAAGGGGGVGGESGTLSMINVTVSGNSALNGGGVYDKKALITTVTNVTINSNSASGSGGGIYRNDGTITLKNTIVANSTSGGNCSGTIASQGYNLDSANTCGFNQAGDKINTNPQLGALQDNGGPTQTHALLAGSLAIDAGTDSGAPATDQRAVVRPQDGDKNGSAITDIGAYEYVRGTIAVLGPIQDTYIDMISSSNFGANATFSVEGENTRRKRALLLFNISSVPVGCQILSATLTMEKVGGDTIGDTIGVHALTRSWAEGNSTSGSGANWSTYDGSNNWATAGGDFDPTVAASAAITASNGLKNWDVTGLVQEWINGTRTNYGVLLKENPEADGNMPIHNFSSREGTISPKLIITYSTIRISSAANQIFTGGDATTAISAITVTDDAANPAITAANDIRIRIPSGFNMSWNTSDTSAVIGGGAAAKVNPMVSYEDGGKTLVVSVTTNFAASDQITISGLSFANFTAASLADNLELEVDNADTVAALDDKTVTILGPTLSSAASQVFAVNDPTTGISPITVTDDSRAPTITAANDLRIRIPSSFNMTWDTADTSAVIGGSAAAKVSTTVSYEDGGKTLVINVTSNFAASDQITISGLSFSGFSAVSAADNLELEVKNNNGVAAYDDKSIAIVRIGFTSAGDQVFTVDGGPQAISPITITDDGSTAMIKAATDIRIRIPDGFNMTWDTFDTTAVITGSAAGKVSTTVSYEDGGKTLVIDVLTDFAAGETITISGLSFANFTAASFTDNLDLEVFNDGDIIATAPTRITIIDPEQGLRDINPDPNLELIPAGSLVIAMDNDKQNLNGSLFNIKAYGLVNSLLWSEIPVKWAIRADKRKDEIDFSATAQRLYPTALPAAALDFRGGPFIVHKYYAAAAKPKIVAFGNQVAVYELTQSLKVDIRYTINMKPKVGVLSDGGTSEIHMDILADAGFVEGVHYSMIPAASLLTVNADSCYTIVSEPHFESASSNNQAQAVRSFVTSGGNFMAQCIALETYENNATYGRFQTTNGIVANDLGNANLVYASPDLSFSQFQGVLSDEGGSRSDWKLAPGSAFRNSGHSHVHNNPQTDTYVATAAKLTGGVGSMVFYLGGHNYSGATLGEINGQRMYLNAVLTYSGRPTACNLYFSDNMVVASISSAADQIFLGGDPPTAISPITVTDDETIPTITAGNDIRIRIPSGFNMNWDTADATAVITGSAAGKVSATVSYEDGGKTLVVNVLTDFAASDQIIIAGLSFKDFMGGSPSDSLQLEVVNDDQITAIDDKIIAMWPPSISSAANQRFRIGDGSTAISPITITEATTLPTITAANDIRIHIPAGTNMSWDTTDVTAVITGTAAGKVSTTVSYEDGGKVLVLDVTADFSASEHIIVSGLSFTDFSAPSAAAKLEMEVRNNGTIQTIDDKNIAIFDVGFSSSDNQNFITGSAAAAISPITVTDDSYTPQITAAKDIRIRIPDNLYMTWLTTDTMAVIGGSAAGKVSTTVSYEDGGKTLVINAITNFSANDYITVSGLSFANFAQASYSEYLQLELGNDGSTIALDEKWIAIGGLPAPGCMLVYGEGNVITPRYRSWDGSTFSLEGSTQNTDDTISWVVLKASPVANEMILGVYSSATKTLFIQTLNGSVWTSNWSVDMNLNPIYRGFDVAYERNSGDAVVVFSDQATRTLKYRKRVGGVWDASNQSIAVLADEANWVRAESRPTNDDIIVAAETNAKTVYAMRWNGAANTWGDQILSASKVMDQNTEAMDIAFERASGDAFLIWGDDANRLLYRQFTTSWQAESIAYAGLPNTIKYLAVDYDPRSASSDIAVAMILGNTTFEFGAWNGTSWVTRPAAIAAKNNDQRGIDVKFDSGNGQAMYIFNQNANARQQAWRIWSATGGFGAVTVEAGATGADINYMQLDANPRGNDLMAVYVDNNSDLFHRYWNGSAWTALTSALEADISDQDKNEAFMFACKCTNPPTAVDLISFTATGRGDSVEVNWETAQEAGNKGFNLYRAEAASGPFVKLNTGLVPASSTSGEGRSYHFTDTGLIRGRLYYYQLEDVDLNGATAIHGPVCVDWDSDGLPDDWEIAHGLNPAVNDADLDSDGDGLVNRLEYARGTDPLNPDTDGDGLPDGAERKTPGAGNGSGGADAGLHVIAADSSGVTLELVTKSFDATPLTAVGQTFERLRIPGYVHGYTLEAGWPHVPLKGVLLDIPEGKSAALKVLDTQSRVLSGYRAYPAPRHQVADDSRVVEAFALNEAAYRADAFYPYADAELSTEYVFRGQTKQRMVLHPLRFNPATGELLQHERLRVRVDFVEAPQTAAASRSISALASDEVPRGLAASSWTIPAGAAYKISTAGEGIYRITRDWLTAQGIGSAEIDAVDLSRVQVFNLGVEQAIQIDDQNANGRLDAGDGIVFYAAAAPAAYAKYAKYNVYWLVNGGSGNPLRMQTVDGTPAAGLLALAHEFTLHHELDQTYLQSAVGPDEMDRWIFSGVAVGTGFAGGGAAKIFTLPLPGALSTGNLKIRMYSPYNMDHAAAVSLNGTPLGSAAWSGIGSSEAQFAGVSLLDGDNTVSITCESGADKIAFDWFELSYARGFKAAGDSLKFTHTGGWRYQIGGFSTQDAILYDISAPAAVKRVVGGTYSGSGPYTLEVEPYGTAGAKTYLSMAPAALRTPASAVKDTASNLSDSANAADWILITHRSLGWDAGGSVEDWANSLVSLRQSQGLRTQVVEVQDIFDEFGYGLPTSQAIKDFLKHAYENWQTPAPQYVLLVGDTTYDYKDNWKLGTMNYVPGYLMYTEHLGETISDDWLVQVSGADAVPDIYIGRLPADSAQQAADMVGKIVAYETADNTKRWERNLLLAADNASDSWESVFETMNEDLAALLPAGLNTPERYYLGEYENESLSVSDLTADLLSGINSGALMLAYSGHASLNIWASERIIDNRGGAYRSDVTELANRGMYPFVVNLSCLTGYFIYPSAGAYASPAWLSLAEGFLRPADTGAVAALMPTAMTSTDGQHLLSNALAEEIFTRDRRILGEAVAAAKQTLLANGGGAYEEVADTFLFFGDPATALKMPLPRRPLGLTAQQQGSAVALSWNAALDCNGRAVSGYHLYRRASGEEAYTRLNSDPISGLIYSDIELAAVMAGDGIFYYVVSAVDSDGDESVKSEPAVVNFSPASSEDGGSGGGSTGGGGSAGSGSGGGGCFISSAQRDRGLNGVALLMLAVVSAAGLALDRRNKRARSGKRTLRLRSGPEGALRSGPAALEASNSGQ